MDQSVRVTKVALNILSIIVLFLGLIITTNLVGASTSEVLIKNGSFEDDLDYWETNGSEAISVKTDSWAAPDGEDKRLDYVDDNSSYQADIYQTITGLENGNYILTAYVANNDKTFNESFMYAGNNDGRDKVTVPRAGDWTQIKLSVAVDDGELTIGFYTDGQAGAWLGVDVVTLVKEDGETSPATSEPKGFIKGLDISSVTKVEDHSGKFYDQGIEKDPFEIFSDYGANYARLVIWKDPVDVDGYNDLSDTIEKAKRIKESGMKLLLNFHYSEFWADPGRQDVPTAWKDYNFDELVQAVYDHTEETLTALEEEGIVPDMIQVGNEIRSGMLFPHGEISENGFSNLAELLDSGIQAVRDAAGGKDIDIMLHLDQGGDNSAYRWWFDEITKEGVTDFQVIGASYYPYWHGTLDQLAFNLNDISERYDKEVVVVETSYGFTLDDADGFGNQFNESFEKVAGYPATEAGQSKFLYDLLEVIKAVPNDRGLGFFYWEPAWLGIKGAGWKSGEGNSWENQALFDFNGNALEALNIYTEGYVAPEAGPRPTDPEPEEDPTLADLVLHSLNKPTTASSSAGNGAEKPNAPQYAVDGNENTSWGTDEGLDAWWQVDLEEVLPIERLLFNFWDGIGQIKIEISDDGETYTTLETFDIKGSNIDLTLPEGTTGRYIKVIITEAASNWVGFMEFQAYGTAEIEGLDQTAPVTEIIIKGELVDGNYIGQVNISFIATDDQSGIDKTEYSFDGGNTWYTYHDKVNVDEIGEHSIQYRSIDIVGNIEDTQKIGFRIIANKDEPEPTVPTTLDSEDDLKKDDSQKTNGESNDDILIDDENQEESEGSLLPQTFTGTFNFLLGGLMLITIGMVFYLRKLRKRRTI